VPAVEPLTADSLFDLASVTKLFTCVALMQLMERGKLTLRDEIVRYEPRFRQLGGVTVYDLLAFQVALSTAARVDEQPDAAAAEAALFSARPAPRPERRFYTDIGAMVLKYVVEAASGLAFETYLEEHVFRPLGMEHTFSHVPARLIHRAVCYNYERRVVDGAFWMDTACEKGVVHDPKARLLATEFGLSGHAGLFSTLGDMVLFARGLLEGALIRRETLLEMGKNRTGHPMAGGGYTQYLGYLCFSKHPDQTYSEVPRCFGERTIALNGFAGNHFSVDPEQNRFIVLLSNRIHNRVTMATGRANPNEKHIETLPWDDGQRYVVSQNYVYYKDENVKDPIGRLFSERF
jgi:CubicO group peptidase (beta-lactamase class C family)